MNRKKKIKEIERLKVQEEKRKQIEKKNKRESRSKMAKWLHKYIEDNSQDWEREKLRHMEERKLKLEEWEIYSRFEKI